LKSATQQALNSSTKVGYIIPLSLHVFSVEKDISFYMFHIFIFP
jgi:hypothetical protein